MVAGLLGLLGLIGLAGLAGLKYPVLPERAGAPIRMMGILGLGGLAAFWIEGAGAMGAAGALGLWNHQSPRLAMWGKLGWVFLIGLGFIVAHFVRG